MTDLNVNEAIENLIKGNWCLPEKSLRLLCERVKEILIDESNIQPVSAPVCICGDIHGQFYDLLELFRKAGELPTKNYIFIGDFVDRGYNSVETLQLLLLYKVKYPSHITLLRGNHESRQITLVYGFYDEVFKKYGNTNVWKYCTDVFDHLPIGAIVEGEIFCVHGGISPNIKTIDQIRILDRKIEIPNEGPFSDLMWSDPDDIETWVLNRRGAGWLFGNRVTKDFNHLNNLQLICRAHQLVNEGYQYWFDEKLVTVWSAPNYCYRCGNVASVLDLNAALNRKWIIFKEVPESAAKSIPLKGIIPYFL